MEGRTVPRGSKETMDKELSTVLVNLQATASLPLGKGLEGGFQNSRPEELHGIYSVLGCP